MCRSGGRAGTRQLASTLDREKIEKLSVEEVIRRGVGYILLIRSAYQLSCVVNFVCSIIMYIGIINFIFLISVE